MNKEMRVRCAKCDLEIECNSCNFSNYIDKEEIINNLNSLISIKSGCCNPHDTSFDRIPCFKIIELINKIKNSEFDNCLLS